MASTSDRRKRYSTLSARLYPSLDPEQRRHFADETNTQILLNEEEQSIDTWITDRDAEWSLHGVDSAGREFYIGKLNFPQEGNHTADFRDFEEDGTSPWMFDRGSITKVVKYRLKGGQKVVGKHITDAVLTSQQPLPLRKPVRALLIDEETAKYIRSFALNPNSSGPHRQAVDAIVLLDNAEMSTSTDTSKRIETVVVNRDLRELANDTPKTTGQPSTGTARDSDSDSESTDSRLLIEEMIYQPHYNRGTRTRSSAPSIQDSTSSSASSSSGRRERTPLGLTITTPPHPEDFETAHVLTLGPDPGVSYVDREILFEEPPTAQLSTRFVSPMFVTYPAELYVDDGSNKNKGKYDTAVYSRFPYCCLMCCVMIVIPAVVMAIIIPLYLTGHLYGFYGATGAKDVGTLSYRKPVEVISLAKQQVFRVKGRHYWHIFHNNGATYMMLLDQRNRRTLTKPTGSNGAADVAASTNDITASTLFVWRTGSFIPTQTVETNGAFLAKTFKINNVLYLVIANQGQIGRRKTDIRVYSVTSNGQLQLLQNIACDNVKNVNYFSVGNLHYLLVSNGAYNTTKTTLGPSLYRLDQKLHRFVPAQINSLPLSGIRGITSFVLDGTTYIAAGKYWDTVKPSFQAGSVIYKYNFTLGKVYPFQSVVTNKVQDVQYFSVPATSCIVYLNGRADLLQRQYIYVYRWNVRTSKFVEHQVIPGQRVDRIHVYIAPDKRPFLTIVNGAGNSMIYRWNYGNDRFEWVHTAVPSGDLLLFNVASDTSAQTYLAKAGHYMTSDNYYINSFILRFRS